MTAPGGIELYQQEFFSGQRKIGEKGMPEPLVYNI